MPLTTKPVLLLRTRLAQGYDISADRLLLMLLMLPLLLLQVH
jgi:hypothetical protein